MVIVAPLGKHEFFFKIVMIVLDIGVMIVLMLMITQRGGSPSRLLFYVANPLVLVYIADQIIKIGLRLCDCPI